MCGNPWDCRDNPLIEGRGTRGAYNPRGRNGNPMNTNGSNSPAVIGERTYSAHAVDLMQERGVTVFLRFRSGVNRGSIGSVPVQTANIIFAYQIAFFSNTVKIV